MERAMPSRAQRQPVSSPGCHHHAPTPGGGGRKTGGGWGEVEKERGEGERERGRERVLTPGGSRLEYKPAPCALCPSLPFQRFGSKQHRAQAAQSCRIPVLAGPQAECHFCVPGKGAPTWGEEEARREQETVQPMEKPGLGGGGEAQQAWVRCLLPAACPLAGWRPLCS